MIILGARPDEKAARIAEYVATHKITRRVIVISPKKYDFPLPLPVEVQWVDWPDIIRYRVYFPLLQYIDGDTLVVVNECLRSKQRQGELHYNCVRHYLQQAGHQLVFQHLPIIDEVSDFATLFDFDTKSRWKRIPFRELPLQEAQVVVHEVPLELVPVPVPTDRATQAAYAQEKERLFAELGSRDPHTLPRNLYLIGGKSKARVIEPGRAYVGRNARLKIPGLTTFQEDAFPQAPYVVVELPHGHLDLIDFLALSGQTRLEVLTADLKVDAWYIERTRKWMQEVRDAYAALRR